MTYATLLVNLESGRSNSQLLLMAAQLAARFQARVIGITACMPIQLLYGDGYIDGEVFEQDRQEIDQEIAAARAVFRDAKGTRPRDLDWRSIVTSGPLAECFPVASDGEDADRLNVTAQEWGADLIAAGADGHSRVREWALGGVTRSLLGTPLRSVFVSH
jgi:nucleotide-binding universal stress UspA family protein